MLTSEQVTQLSGDAWIETSSGRTFDPFSYNPDFAIEDIAHALSNISRWNGHCRHFYSVAQHSILVSQIMDSYGWDPLEGLLHDGTEAYLCDIPSPFKQLFPDWAKVDKKLERNLRDYFGLPLTKSDNCKHADWLALYIEADRLMPSRAKTWPYLDKEMHKEAMAIKGDFTIRAEDPSDVKWAFLDRYDYYTTGLGNVNHV
jgi:hypothetical protein